MVTAVSFCHWLAWPTHCQAPDLPNLYPCWSSPLGEGHTSIQQWLAVRCLLMGDKVSDETLMLEYAQGDAASFETLYRRHKDAMYRYLLRQCQNSATAEELFQDIWLRIINARQDYSVKASFRTWLYQIAHNRLIDHYRRQNTRKLESYLDNAVLENTASTEVSDPQRIVNGQQQATQLLQLIADLPEAQREAFLLKEEAGMTLAEIATDTGAKSETVKSRLRYAFNRLREKMGLD